MTIKQQGGVFGRNPTFNNVEVNTLTADGNAFVNALGVNTTSLASVSGFGFGNFSGSSGGGIVLQQSGAPKASIASFGNDQYIDAVGKTVIRTGATVTGAPVNVMEFQADRNVKMSAGNLIFINGTGIDFSATSGTGTSELFDDYEEGTWTPEITSGATGVTYSTQVGHYTKVGNLVTFSGRITTTAATADANQFRIGGLPFTAANLTFGGAYMTYANSNFQASTTANNPTLTVAQNQSRMDFYATNGAPVSGTSFPNLAAAIVYFTGHFYTS